VGAPLVRGSDLVVAHFQQVEVLFWRPEMMDEGPADLRELVRLPVIVFPAWIRFVALLWRGVSS